MRVYRFWTICAWFITSPSFLITYSKYHALSVTDNNIRLSRCIFRQKKIIWGILPFGGEIHILKHIFVSNTPKYYTRKTILQIFNITVTINTTQHLKLLSLCNYAFSCICFAFVLEVCVSNWNDRFREIVVATVC